MSQTIYVTNANRNKEILAKAQKEVTLEARRKESFVYLNITGYVKCKCNREERI